MMNIELKSKIRLLRTAVGSILRVDNPDIRDWDRYKQAIRTGIVHLEREIPPAKCPTVAMHEATRDLCDRLALIAAVPVCLYNVFLPVKRKIGFVNLAESYKDSDILRLKDSFELFNYLLHVQMFGRSIEAALLEIWHEDEFLTPEIRKSLHIIEAASSENRLSTSVLQDAIGGHAELLADLIRGCYLCIRHSSAEGIVREAKTIEANGFALSSGLILHALEHFDEIEETEHALTPEDADCFKRIGQKTKEATWPVGKFY